MGNAPNAAMTPAHDADGVLAHFADDDTRLRVDAGAVAVLNRSEVEAQLDAAHRYPRSVGRFLQQSIKLATISVDVAESCIYALPRAGKTISGPSVRLAEIVASCWGNLHIGARVLDAEEKEIVAMGIAWDLESNLRCQIEARRRITKKSGERYDDDMIGVAGAAAGSIALRNAIFRVVPRAYVQTIYAKVRDVAVGDAKTFSTRRDEVCSRLEKMGVPRERILSRVGRETFTDVTIEDLEVLVGLGTAIRDGSTNIDAAFPDKPGSPKTSEASRDLEAELRGKKLAAPAKSPPPGPTHEHPPIDCAKCGKPVSGEAIRVPGEDDSKPRFFHPACAGEEGDKPLPKPTKKKEAKSAAEKTPAPPPAPSGPTPCAACGKPVDFSKGGVMWQGKPHHEDCTAEASKSGAREPGQEG